MLDTVKDVAILGGGITGLATAHYLSEEYPDAKVTLYESKPHLGGWMNSKVVDVGDGEVIFESGPRSLRPQAPNGTLALRLVQDLGLTGDLLVTSKSAAAAQNRFVYYPDHLVRMPGPGQTVWNLFKNLIDEPIFKGAISGALLEGFRPTRARELPDESVGSFVSRRGSKSVANNLVSAVFHGIYAGDIWKLSAKSILPLPWAREAKHGNLASAAWAAMVQRQSWNFCDDVELQMRLQDGAWHPDLRKQIVDASVFTFKRGISQMTEALEERVTRKRNVKVMKSTQVTALQKVGDTSNIQITSTPVSNSTESPSANISEHTHVISAITPSTTLDLLTPTLSSYPASTLRKLDRLRSIPAVTVCVVNLYFRTPHLLRKTHIPGGLPTGLPLGLSGFGYLIPRTIPFEQNPERALGVIFDSDISPTLHTTVSPDTLGTRLTVMLGGHWWDGWSSYPSDTEAQEMARSVLARHLGITEEPAAMATTLQRNCIPQYTVGHSARMTQAHEGLLEAFGGRLRVAGSWYTGVGVNDCLRAAWDVAQGLKDAERVGGSVKKRELSASRTGLERFAWGRPMALVVRAAPEKMEIAAMEEQAVGLGYFENASKYRDDD